MTKTLRQKQLRKQANAANGQQVAKKKTRKPRQVIGKMVKAPNSNGSILALDARKTVHIPPPLPMGPYTILRGRSVYSLTTGTVTTNTVMLVGAHRVASVDSCVTPLLATVGSGVNVPGTTETNVVDSLISTYGTGNLQSSVANAALHAVTVTVQCTNSATAANGVVYVGTLAQRIGRQNYATWNGVASALLSRREVSSFSAYNTMTNPVVVSSYPIDMVEWSTQQPLIAVDANASNNYCGDTLAQIALVFPPTTTAVDYNITIHTEWRVNFVDAALSSTSIKHEPTESGFWNKTINMASTLNGFLDNAVHIGSQVGAAVNAYRGVANTLGQLGNMARPLAALMP